MLCTGGGGQDGAALAGAFTDAELPAARLGVLICGPFLPAGIRDELRARAARRDDLII